MKQLKIKLVLLLCVFVLIAVAINFSYAAFRLHGEKVGDALVGTASNIGLYFEGDDQLGGTSITPGDSIVKTFRIINNSNNAETYDLYFSDVINTINRNNDLVYTLTSTNDGASITTTVFPDIDSEITTGILINPHVTQEYTLTITYLNSIENQDIDRGFSLSTKIMVDNEMPRYNLLGNYYDSNGDLLTSGKVVVHSEVIEANINSDGTFLIENIPLGSHTIEIYNNENTLLDSGTFKLKRGTTESVNNNVITGADNKTISIITNKVGSKLEISSELNSYSIDLYVNNGVISKNLLVAYNNMNTEIVSISPNEHYHFVNVDCSDGLIPILNSDNTTLKFNNVTTSGSCTINYLIDNYSVTFLANHGSVSPNVRNVAHNDTTTASATPDVGYKYDSVSCTNDLTASHEEGVITTGNVLNASTCTVNNIKDSFRVDVNSKKNGVVGSYGYEGFTFNVWIDDELVQDSIIDYTANILYESKVRVKANDVTGYTTNYDETFYVPAETTIVYPTWTANTYTISYALNNGSYGTNYPTTGTYDEAFTVNNPTRTGYSFSGWNISGLDSVTHTYGTNTTTDTSINGTKETSYKNLRSTSGTVTYTATWSANTYTLTYDNNGGSGCTSTTAKYDANWTPSCVPTKANSTFSGWYTAASGGSLIHTGTKVTGDLTAYAHYSACTACSAGTGANCSLSVSNNTCTYTTSCKSGYNSITNNGKYNPSCSANTYTVAFSVSNGSKPSNGTISYGDSKAFTSSANAGYTYSSASCNNGASISRSGNTYTVSGIPNTVANGATITCTINYTDQTKPNAVTSASIYKASVTSSKATITIKTAGASDSGSGISKYQFYINNSWVDSTSNEYTINYTTSNKTTTYNITKIRVVDKAGNISSEYSYSRSITVKRIYIWQLYTYMRASANTTVIGQPTESEINTWANKTKAADIAYNMFTSSESQTNYNSAGASAYAARMYLGILGRTADSGGQSYVAGLGLSAGAKYLANSDEAQTLYSTWGIGTGTI